MKRIAIYARVSTSDEGHGPENQFVPLRARCRRAGHTIAVAHVEHESGRKDESGRKELARLLQDAARRDFDLGTRVQKAVGEPMENDELSLMSGGPGFRHVTRPDCQ